MTLLSEKAVIITGAGRGLGAAYARLAAREGASVIADRGTSAVPHGPPGHSRSGRRGRRGLERGQHRGRVRGRTGDATGPDRSGERAEGRLPGRPGTALGRPEEIARTGNRVCVACAPPPPFPCRRLPCPRNRGHASCRIILVLELRKWLIAF